MTGVQTVGSIFVILFSVLLVLPWGVLLYKLRRCGTAVDAEIVEIKEHISSSSDGTTHTYAPVYGYWFEGAEYRVTAKIYSNIAAGKVGDHVELRIDPNKPEYCLDLKRSLKLAILETVIFGAFLAAGIFMIRR